MPTAEAPGKLKNRDDKKLVNTDKEKVSSFVFLVNILYLILNSKYKQLAQCTPGIHLLAGSIGI